MNIEHSVSPIPKYLRRFNKFRPEADRVLAGVKNSGIQDLPVDATYPARS
ncbi:MAG: hypothetical protein M3Y57_11915 [Acidobacteriota bacterium]|nr:hypothetical protein [Acidobacteriota bacterium]